MAMQNVEKNYVSTESNIIKILLSQYGDMSQQNVLWAGSPDYQHSITQDDLNSVPSFMDAGLTTQQLADASYAVEQIRGILTAQLPALTVLAKLP